MKRLSSFASYIHAFGVIKSSYKAFIPGFIFVSLLFALVSIVSAIVPWFLKEATNAFTADRTETNTFYLFVAGYALCWTMAEVLANIKGVFSAWVLAGCDATISKILLARVMNMSYSEQAQLNVGKVVAIITRASGAFSAITVYVFWTLIPILVEFIVALIALGQSTNDLFLISFLISIIILAAISILIAIQSRDLYSSLYKSMTDRDGYIVERLHLLYDIRLNNAYEKESGITEHHLNKVVQAIRHSNLQIGIRLGLMALAIGVALGVFTALSVFTDKSLGVTAGDFVMIAGYVGMLTLQLRLLAGALIDLEKQKVALADGVAYLEKPISEMQTTKPMSPANTDYVFELRNICIEKGGKKIIKSLNFHFLNNRFTVIKGASGRGKTSLMNAMLGLEPVAAGQILFYGVPVSTSISSSIIGHVAVAPQSAQVISGTLRDNLCYGLDQEAVPDTFLTDILRLLNFTESSLGEPMNLDTWVDARGVALSGGERQRTAIGRAIARQKKIMILDEPTASLDLDNAKRIIMHLRSQIPTLIVITHDVEVQNMADEILELG